LVRSAALIKAEPRKASSSFLHHWLRGRHAQNQIANGLSRAAQPNLFLGSIQQIRAPLPPTLLEQEAIAGALSDADAWIESLEQLIAKKRQIKQGAMQELLTGKRRLPGFSGKWAKTTLGELGRWAGGLTLWMGNSIYW
jgi:type I restriction enzyme S subunit